MKSSTPAILRRLLETQQAQLTKTIATLGLKPTATLLDEARRRLRGDIQDAIRRGGNESFTVAQRRQMLQTLEIGIAELTRKFGPIVTGVSDAAMQQSVDHLSKEIGVYAKKWGRSPEPVSGIHTASHFLDRQTALRNLTVIDPDTMRAIKKANTRSVARYGDDLITAFERELAIGKVAGYSVDEMTDKLLGVGESVFNGERYRAERIVVNETLNAYSTARHEAIQEFSQDVGGVKRIWVSAGEDGRTCEMCLAMHGQVRGTDEPFSSNGTPIARPPRHVRCRCVEAIWFNEDKAPAFWQPKE